MAISYYQIQEKYKEEWRKGNRISYDQARHLIRQEALAKTQAQSIAPAGQVGPARTPDPYNLTYKGLSTEPGTAEDVLNPQYKYHDPQDEHPLDPLWDAIGGTVWGFGKTASLGLTDFIPRKVFGDEMIDEVLADWSSSKLGRFGMQVGELGGFLRGMGLVKSAMAKGTNLIPGLAGTTRGLQRKAGEKLAKDINQTLLKNLNKTGVGKKETQQLVKDMTDDVVGFGNSSGVASRSKSSWDFLNPFSHGPKPYMGMRTGNSYVSTATNMLRATTPGKLKSFLAAKKIAASSDDVARMSDDIIKQVTKNPINNLDDLIVGKWGGKFSQIVGGIAQETIDLAVVGTLMDAHMYANGELKPKLGQSWGGLFGEQLLHHSLTGAAFGGIRTGLGIPFFMGGSSIPNYQKVMKALDKTPWANQALKKFGGNVKGFNKHIKSIKDPKALKGILKSTMEQNRNFTISLKNGNELFHNSPIFKQRWSADDMQTVKQGIINWNNNALSTFRKGVPLDIAKDLIMSSPRWGTGAVIMNWSGLNSGVFDHMDPDEALSHFILSAWMTKRGKPLRSKGSQNPEFGWNTGERPYYYQENLTEIHKTMQSLGYNTTHISDIVKAYDVNVWESHMSKVENNDVTEIIKTLERNNIIYNKEEYIEKMGGDLRADGTGEVINSELNKLVFPIAGLLKARGYNWNPNMKSDGMVSSISEIHKLKSSVLSTASNEIPLNSSDRIFASVMKGTEQLWSEKTQQIFDLYKQQVHLLTGDRNFVDGNGRVKNVLSLSADKLKLSHKQQRAVSEFLQIQEHLKGVGLIKIQEHNVGRQFGHNVQKALKDKIEVFATNHDNLSKALGQEVFGTNSNEPIDMTSPEMWMMIGRNIFNRNIRTNYDILFNNKEGLPKDIRISTVDDINSLTHQILVPNSHRGQMEVILDDIRNLKMDVTEKDYIKLSVDNPSEIHQLTEMMHNLYSVMKTGSSPVGGSSTYTVSQAQELRGKLIELGMPDPLRNKGEDFRIWTEQMVNHGINEAIGGLDISPEISYSINRLMENGLISVHKGNNHLGSRLEMVRDISIEEIQRLNPNIKEPQAKELQEYYREIVENIPNKAVNKTDRIGLLNLTENQLATIRAARSTINMNEHFTKSKELHQPVIDTVIDLQESRQLLESSLKDQDTMNPTDVESIKSKMKMIDQQEVIIRDWSLKFWNNVMGVSGDITRSASFYHHVLNTRIDNKSIAELFAELSTAGESLDYKTFDTISENIRGLQQEIAKRWLNRPEVFTDTEIQRQDSFIHHQAEELQGKLNSDGKNTMSPDNFFVEYASTKDIPMMDKVSEQVANNGGKSKIYSNATEALYDLYEKTAGIGQGNNFKDALYEIAGMKQGQAPSGKLKNDVVKLNNLFERQFSANRIQLNVGGDNKSLSYTGSFKRSQITHSSFTDLFTEIFPGIELNLLSDQILYKGKLTTLRGEATGDLGLFENLVSIVNQNQFVMTEQSGATRNQKLASPGAEVEVGKDMYETFDMNKQGFKGKQYIVGVDENITFLIPHENFKDIGLKFTKWYANAVKDPYVINSIKNYDGAKVLFERLAKYNKYLNEALLDGEYNPELFRKQTKMGSNRLMNKAIHEMFNVMYGDKVDKNWLHSAYAENMSYKDFKYKRLASNQGYARNTAKRRDFVLDVWGGDKGYVGDIVRKYSPMNEYYNFVVDDAINVSKTGEASTGYITDNRSVAEKSVNEMYNNNKINKTQRDYMLSKLFNSHSINAESVNSATVVRRSYLDYILVSEANSQLIGDSPGHKPVGVSSFIDANGNRHVFYNKTHYFYDKKFDQFFANNPNIEQLTFTSGAKKAQIINPNDPNLTNKLVPAISPKVSDKINLPDWLNNPKNFKSLTYADGRNGVMAIDANQNLVGATYGTSKGAKILKQLGNWSENQSLLYQYSRADAIKNFGAISYNLYDPSRPAEANAFAREYLAQKNNKGSSHNPENENISLAALWINSGGVPYSRISKNLYDNMIKSKFIDDAGVFDGFTSAGGNPTLRPDFTGKLNIPVYTEIEGVEVQTILGESNIGFNFMDRTIPFTGKFGTTKVEKAAKGTVRKALAEEVSTISISVNIPHKKYGNRDIAIDIKNGTVYDPMGEFTSDNLPREYKKLTKEISDKIYSGKLVLLRDVWSYLRLSDVVNKYGEVNMLDMFSALPKTGPHDLIVTKIKDMISKKDGGVVELNPYDLTLRAQSDFDTDKLPLYIDTPFGLLSEAYKTNSLIAEAIPMAPELKLKPKFDPYNADDFFTQKGRIKDADFLRGKVQKEHRKLDFAHQVFRELKTIALPFEGGKLELIFDKQPSNLQRLTNDSQAILDPYNGVPKNVFDKSWTDNTRYGRSDYFGDQSNRVSVNDNPFFKMKFTDSSGKEHPIDIVSEPILKAISNKMLTDYGNLLTVETGIWQGGERKTPRYQDMLTLWRNFRSEYHPKRINWNFYNSLKQADIQGIDKIFFPDGKKDASGKIIEIANIFGNLSEVVRKNPTTFLKSLSGITSHDMLRMRENVNPQGDYFNQGIMKWLGRYRGEILEKIKLDQDVPAIIDETPIIDNLWKSFSSKTKNEELMVQLNNLEEQLSSLESILSRKYEQKIDNSETHRLADDVAIKRNALIIMTDKLMVENGVDSKDQLPNIKVIKGGKDVVAYGAGVLRDKVTGKVKATFPEGSTDIAVAKGEVFLKGGIQLIPISNHEMLDAVAFANSTLGYMANIHQSDLPKFKQIIYDTQKEIKKSMKEIMEYNKWKDWSRHYAKTQEAIDKGLQRIEALANESADFSTISETNVGNYPKGRETYGIDFLMGLLVPSNKSNRDRSVYYNPKTSQFLPAVKNINKSVIDAVFQSLKNYNLVPDYNGFVMDLAKAHSSNYEALVAGEGFNRAVKDLEQTTFEGALLGRVIDNVLHDPFVSVKEYKTFAENAEINRTIGSEFAELYRQILQEGTMTDPVTTFKLKKRLIDSYGQEAYNSLFMKSRGDLVFDGISTRQFGTGKGQGQLIGEILNASAYKRYNVPLVIRKGSEASEIRRIGNENIGDNNLRRKKGLCE